MNSVVFQSRSIFHCKSGSGELDFGALLRTGQVLLRVCCRFVPGLEWILAGKLFPVDDCRISFLGLLSIGS